MKKSLILFSKIFYKHDPPRGVYHPENSLRLDIALNAIKRENLYDRVEIVDTIDQRYYLYRDRVHEKHYVEYIKKLCIAKNEGFIDSDTYINQHSFDVATHALGCSVYAVELSLNMKEFLVFALVRPPGHHAGLNGKAMGASTQGFCIFNNVAAGALYALDKGLKPVTILDIDVHHGNGTQEIFWTNPDVIHIDIHEEGIYPGTGYIEDLGGGDAYGTKINIPLKPFSGDPEYIYVFEELVIPLLYVIKPRCVIVSAGFDTHEKEEISDMNVTSRFYKYLGSILRILSLRLGLGVVAVLEGGYSAGLDEGLPAFIKGFEEPDVDGVKLSTKPSKYVVDVVKKIHSLVKRLHYSI
jgi:acetoin utilization deacetylase AcuC-like enzyme